METGGYVETEKGLVVDMGKYFLAIDIGASSGRHILGSLQNGKIELEEVHRFWNGMDDIDGTLCWNVDRLFNEIIEGMKNAVKSGKFPRVSGLIHGVWILS